MQPSVDTRLMEEALGAIREVLSEEGGAAAGPEPQRSDETTTKPQAGLLSPRATTAVSSAVNRLTTSVKKQEPTLEDVVRDMLRPMLKSWLDENLPAVVERIVEAEIERAVRGR